jgi:hypothetical protein
LDEETIDRNFKLYPNPANFELFLEFPDIKGSICIVNLLGQEVLKENNFSGYALLNISNLNRGSYLVQVHGIDGQLWTKPLIIQ